MMARDRRQFDAVLFVRVPTSLLEQLDAAADDLAIEHPASTWSRAKVVRSMLSHGLQGHGVRRQRPSTRAGDDSSTASAAPVHEGR